MMSTKRFLYGFGLLLAATGGLTTATAQRSLYPDGVAVPKYMTREEALRWEPPTNLRSAGPPPSPIHAPGEYDEMAGILVSYRGSAAQQNVLTDMARHITGPHGRATFYAVVSSVSQQNSVASSLAAAGVNMDRVKFIIRTTDTIWIRDYGPFYVYAGNVRVIVDHTYNRPRPNDNLMPTGFAAYKSHARYDLPLVHGAGNWHNDSLGSGQITRLINQENTSLSESQIHNLFFQFKNVLTTFHNRFPTTVDSTGHIDMWMQVIGPKKAIISEWPDHPTSTQAAICDSAANLLAANGWTVHRVPATVISGVHYTYTNSVMCNDVVMIPSYTSGTGVATRNAQALAVFQAALPNKQIVQVNAQSLITSAGALHCVTKHVPAPKSGANPASHVLSPNGGETLTPGQPTTIAWISDDDKSVKEADLLLSLDGGQSYPYTIATGVPDSGNFTWNVPNLATNQARVKVRVRDHDGNTGDSSSAANFAIAGSPAAALDSITMQLGAILSGGVAQLGMSDNQYLVTQAPFATRLPLAFVVAATSPVANPASLEIALESRVNHPGIFEEVLVRNWLTNDWTSLSYHAVPQSDRLLVFGNVPGGPHVRADGRIELMVRHFARSDFRQPLQSNFDHLRIVPKP
jgi:agmatine deiminase